MYISNRAKPLDIEIPLKILYDPLNITSAYF